MTVDQALEQVIRETQGALNGLQERLRALCANEEQKVDDDEDFKECIRLEEETQDLVEMITQLLSELIPIAADIRGSCPPESKEWYAQHREVRKAELAAEKSRRQAAVRQAKEEARAAKANAKTSK
jgi:hypothetical protein